MSEMINLSMVFEGESILRPGREAAGTAVLVHGIEGMHSCQTLKEEDERPTSVLKAGSLHWVNMIQNPCDHPLVSEIKVEPHLLKDMKLGVRINHSDGIVRGAQLIDLKVQVYGKDQDFKGGDTCVIKISQVYQKQKYVFYALMVRNGDELAAIVSQQEQEAVRKKEMGRQQKLLAFQQEVVAMEKRHVTQQ